MKRFDLALGIAVLGVNERAALGPAPEFALKKEAR